MRHVEALEQFDRRRGLFEFALAPEDMQHARALFVVEIEGRFDLADHPPRQIDERPQARVLSGERVGIAQEGELFLEIAGRGVEARP